MNEFEIKVAERRNDIIQKYPKLEAEFQKYKDKFVGCCGKDEIESFAKFIQNFVVNHYGNKDEFFNIIKGTYDILDIINKINPDKILTKAPCGGCGSNKNVIAKNSLTINEKDSPVQNLLQMGIKAKDCILCTKKHIRYAMAVMLEIINGYDKDPVHVKLLEGNFIAAEQHILMISRDLASKIRLLRLDIFEIQKSLSMQHFDTSVQIDDAILKLMEQAHLSDFNMPVK